MFIYIAGAGAMGCRFGYQLQKAGNEVVLLDNWEEHIEKIRKDGLSILGDKETKAYIKIMHPKDATKEADFIILFTKAMGLEKMLIDIRQVMGKNTKVLCLLNGLGHKEVISQYVPKENIIMGVTVWTAGLKKPGEVLLQGNGSVNLQSFSSRGEDDIKDIISCMNEAELNVFYDNDVIPSIWRKACVNGTMNSTCAITDSTIGEFFSSESGLNIVKEIIHEFVLVGNKEGINLDENKIFEYVMHTSKNVAKHYPSMHQDLIQNHRLTEVDYINGAIARKGKKYNINTPYCAMITDLIHAKEDILGIR